MQYVSSRGFVIMIMITQVNPSKAHPTKQDKKKYFILSMRIAGHARMLFSRKMTMETSGWLKKKKGCRR